MLNPIELAWSGLKDFVRKNNTNFRFADVRTLASDWMTSLSASSAAAYIDHVYKIEEIFKRSDEFIEHLEDELVDEEEEIDSDGVFD